ncbi:hypothetical protein [Streptomyces sp. NPDC047999]|uniref:hypothetical protein n=1 Tax=Streptomyces sp. NPDC047999 TaxID=3365497 RepID=UPI003723A7E7
MAIGVEGRIRAWASTREWSTWYAQGIVTGVGATREQAELADIHGDGRGGYYWVADGGAVPVWLCNGIVRKVGSSRR